MATRKNKDKQTVHFVDPYLHNPMHPITVTLVGAGGNGCQMMSALGKIDAALTALGYQGLHVTTYDGDTVERANIGRQLFNPGEIGQYKSVCLTTRFNRFYNTDWDAEARNINKGDELGNITITCVDNVKARLLVEEMFNDRAYTGDDRKRKLYWMDLGNSQRTGQVVLTSTSIKQPASTMFKVMDTLPGISETLHLKDVDEKDSGPSCSLAEALKKQDLFINPSLSALAGSLLWRLLMDAAIDTRGFYLNLDSMKMQPIMLSASPA